MAPIKYYYPERLFDLAIAQAKGWGRSQKNRTYKSEIGDVPCIDVMDYEGDTIYLLIISDELYNTSDRRERATMEDRFLIIHSEGETTLFARSKLQATKQAMEYCKERNLKLKKVAYMRG
jgi:hypothetical protein